MSNQHENKCRHNKKERDISLNKKVVFLNRKNLTMTE